MTKDRSDWRIAVQLYLNEEYGRQVFIGVEDYVYEHPALSVAIVEVGTRGTRADEYRKLRDFDAAIVALKHEQVRWRRENVPIPIVGTPLLYEPTSEPTVAPDSRRVGAMAAEHFASLDLKHATVACRSWKADFSELINGFHDGAMSCGIEPLPPCISEPDHAPDYAEWLRSLPKPAGILCDRDSSAQALVLAAQAGGLRIPDDVCVCGIGNDVFADVGVRPRLSSVAVRPGRIGWLAAQTAHRLLGGESVEPIRVPPQGVVARGSTNYVAADDPLVAEAVRYIRSHGGKIVPVDAVATHVGVSRRAIETRFLAATGHTIRDEVVRCRIERAKHLLANTDKPIKSIALMLGMRNPNNLSQFMVRYTGLTPTRFRRQHRPD